jgi:DNA-binding GntR family transcriptional regulator
MLASERLIYERSPLLADSTFETLLAEIVTGDYQPRSRLRADDIAHRYGVSRTPVREALLRLSWMQFVVISRNSRTEVADWAAGDMRERLVMLERLASQSAQMTGGHVDSAELQRRAGAVTSPSGDVQLFLSICLELVHSAYERVGTNSVAGLVRPLRLFYCHDVLVHHDIDLSRNHEKRHGRLAAVIESLAEGDHKRACRELERYVSMVAAVTLDAPRRPRSSRLRRYPFPATAIQVRAGDHVNAWRGTGRAR